MDVKLIAMTSFQFGGVIQREGKEITVDRGFLQAEIDKGLSKSGKPLSGLVNHCEPNCELSTEIFASIGKKASPKETKVNQETEAAAIKEELSAMGVAYDKRWGLARFRNELIAARKAKGA